MTLVTILEDQTPWSKRGFGNTHATSHVEAISYYTKTEGQAAAEEAFHCSNAPEEILTESEKVLASFWTGHRSLSVGDIVKVGGVSYRCESFGWKIV